MSRTHKKFPKATRPGEYVAFFVIQVPTKEAMGYAFLACDAFSEFGFVMGIETNESPETVLKQVYMLTENPDFIRHMHKGFTLVFDRFEELEEKINAILKHVHGKAIFDKEFNKRIAAPFRDSFLERFKSFGARSSSGER